MKHQWQKSPPQLIEYFLQISPKEPHVEHRKMFGYPCCFVNGNMFCGLHGLNIVIRLSEKDRQEFLKIKNSAQFEPMPGHFMKEYIVVPQEMKSNPQKIQPWLAKSLTYAENLPPKVKKPKK